jgi:Uma2 family endonuclease
MSSLPKVYFSPEEYLERERRAEYKSEYFVGDIVAMAGAKRNHNLVSNNVSASLTAQLRDAPCEVYANDMRVQADGEKQYSYPDVVIVCGEPQFRDGREDTLLTPTIVVEVLSPSTESRDRGEKFLRYRQISSLTDYLLIAQNERRGEQFIRQADGSWRMVETSNEGEVRLESVGCTLALANIYNKVVLEPSLRLVSDEPR